MQQYIGRVKQWWIWKKYGENVKKCRMSCLYGVGTLAFK